MWTWFWKPSGTYQVHSALIEGYSAPPLLTPFTVLKTPFKFPASELHGLRRAKAAAADRASWPCCPVGQIVACLRGWRARVSRLAPATRLLARARPNVEARRTRFVGNVARLCASHRQEPPSLLGSSADLARGGTLWPLRPVSELVAGLSELVVNVAPCSHTRPSTLSGQTGKSGQWRYCARLQFSTEAST